MKRGFFGPIIIIIAIVVFLIVEMTVASTLFKKERLEHRHLLEASVISQNDKVETVVRSFLRATDLSSLQGIDAFGTGQIVLPYDFDVNDVKYHRTYNLSYWQIYNTKSIPPKEVLLNKARQKIGWVSSSYLENYLDDYKSFLGTDITLEGFPGLIVKSMVDGEIVTIHSGAIEFKAKASSEVEGNVVEIEREFRPYSVIITRFEDVVEGAEYIIDNDLLGKLIKNEDPDYLHNIDDLGEVRDQLDNLADDLLLVEPGIKIILKIPEDSDYKYDVEAGTTAAIINVMIYDESTSYTFYDFPTDEVRVRYLGVNFLAKVGNSGLIGNTDEEEVQNLPDFKPCPSGLGIISPKNDICDFFTVSPDTCDDPDLLNPNKYTTKNTCEDFTGEYTDLCFDSDGDGTDDTVYEYDCYPTSEICYYIEHRCGSDECLDGACTITCSSDPDCDDSNACTGVEADGGIDKCRNPGADDAYCDSPNLPSTYVPPGDACGTTPRLCGETGDCTQNCQAVGNTWMCDGPPNKECPNTCDGFGGCDGCTPPTCDQEDCGCADDTYCSPGYKCKLSTNECTLDECDSDSDCTDPKTDCQYWTCDRPTDPDSDCVLNNWFNGYIPPGNTCGEDERSCLGECKDIKFEYRDPVGDTVKCARECDGSGGCKASCTPPACSYTSIRECLYGCKDGMDCWQGYFCPPKTCGDTCCGPCTGTSCTTWEGCVREDMPMTQTCTWQDRWDNLGCIIFGCGPGEWCEWPCCVTDRTCTETCTYSDVCTYI